MGHLSRMATGFFVLQALHVSVAWACTCSSDLSAEDYVASGDAIVVGTITSTQRGCGTGTVRATVDVEEVIAGPGAVGLVTVVTNDSGAACGLEGLDEGERWILQIFGEDRVAMCTASKQLESADDSDLAALREAAD